MKIDSTDLISIIVIVQCVNIFSLTNGSVLTPVELNISHCVIHNITWLLAQWGYTYLAVQYKIRSSAQYIDQLVYCAHFCANGQSAENELLYIN
jgi:hypothetical protein